MRDMLSVGLASVSSTVCPQGSGALTTLASVSLSEDPDTTRVPDRTRLCELFVAPTSGWAQTHPASVELSGGPEMIRMAGPDSPL